SEFAALVSQLARTLKELPDADAQREVLYYLGLQTLTELANGHPEPFPRTPLSAEFLEWARQQFTDEEIVAGIRDVQENGGMELHEFIHEIEAEATPRE